MKKVLFFIMTILSLNLFAQENNPYNQIGVDYVKSLNIINEDFKAGKIKDFSKEAIEEYSKKLPLKVEVNMEMVSTVYTTLKSKDFDLTKTIQQSNLPKLTKEVLLNIAVNYGHLTQEQLNQYLVNTTEDVKKSELSDKEKELTLSFVAIASNLNSSGMAQKTECFIDGPNGSGPTSCILAGAIGGGLIGFEICGGWCAVGGAVIGGILGAVS